MIELEVGQKWVNKINPDNWFIIFNNDTEYYGIFKFVDSSGRVNYYDKSISSLINDVCKLDYSYLVIKQFDKDLKDLLE